jgi:hypothetical protein
MKRLIPFFLTISILILFISCSNAQTINSQINSSVENQAVGTFDVSVQINIKVILNEKVKDTNPNIVRAARQALFTMYCDRAKFSHYNNYNINDTMKISEVIAKGNAEWEVRFNETENSYSFVTVNKQKGGNYVGSIVYGNPFEPLGETY